LTKCEMKLTALQAQTERELQYFKEWQERQNGALLKLEKHMGDINHKLEHKLESLDEKMADFISICREDKIKTVTGKESVEKYISKQNERLTRTVMLVGAVMSIISIAVGLTARFL
jgi:hypothetical protein